METFRVSGSGIPYPPDLSNISAYLFLNEDRLLLKKLSPHCDDVVYFSLLGFGLSIFLSQSAIYQSLFLPHFNPVATVLLGIVERHIRMLQQILKRGILFTQGRHPYAD